MSGDEQAINASLTISDLMDTVLSENKIIFESAQ